MGRYIDNNGNIITGSEQKSVYFNDFFLNIALDLTRDLSPLPSDTTNFIYKVCRTTVCLVFSVEWNIVQEIVQKSLKLCESSVVQGLFEICMKSRADCQFPISWKRSQVAAVFKKGNRLDVNNYYIPISLLSIPSKILERVVCRSFDNHLTTQLVSCLIDNGDLGRVIPQRAFCCTLPKCGKKPWTMDLK